jgi:hypothetical protein
MTATSEDAKRYCPVNSKCRGDNQPSLCPDDYDVGTCKLDGEKCHFAACSILKKMMEYDGECP